MNDELETEKLFDDNGKSVTNNLDKNSNVKQNNYNINNNMNSNVSNSNRIQNNKSKTLNNNKLNLLSKNKSNSNINNNQNSNNSLINKNNKLINKKPLTNRFKKKETPESTGEQAVKKTIRVAVKTVLVVLAPLLFIMGLIIFLLLLIMIIFMSIFNSNDIKSDIKSGVINYASNNATQEEIASDLKYNGLCELDLSDEECLDTPAGKYVLHYKEIKDKYENYLDYDGNPLNINIELIQEIIMYDLVDIDILDDSTSENYNSIYSKYMDFADILAEAMVEEYKMYGDYYYMVDSHPEFQENRYIKSKSGETTFYRISYDKLNSYLLYGEVHENYNGETKEYDTDIYPGSTPSLIPGGREINLPKDMDNVSETSYSGNVKDGFIYKNILTENDIKDKNDEQIEKLAKSILKDIYSTIMENNNIIIYSNICPGVNVTGNYAGVYSLEDYVAGVVQNENNWSQGDNIENMKAQAIAARTYVLRITNNCALPIENSTKKQTMNPNPSEKAKQAASETAGKVLTSNGKYISTEYDGLAVKEKTDEFYILKQADLQIPISWLDKYLSEKDYQYYANHTHGRGMSQWGSRYLQTIGYDYNKILKTFYPSAEITTLGGSGSQILTNVPSGVSDLQSRYYFTFDIEKKNYYNNTLFGQCVWYAKHRAMEIVAANGNESKVSLIETAYGNGIDIAKSLANKGFRYSDNIYDVRPGSIISWKWTDAKCRSFHGGYSCGSGYTNYGHVAVVESVTYDSNGVPVSVIITEGWRTNCGEGSWCTNSNIWSVVNFKKKSLTISALENNSGYGIFNGLAFLN